MGNRTWHTLHFLPYALIVGVLLMLVAPGHSDAAQTRLRIGVRDHQGSPIPGATLTVRLKGKSYSVVTDAEGFATIPNRYPVLAARKRTCRVHELQTIAGCSAYMLLGSGNVRLCGPGRE